MFLEKIYNEKVNQEVVYYYTRNLRTNKTIKLVLRQ